MHSIQPPTPDEIYAWGWEMGVEAGRRLAEESDAFIGVTLPCLETPAALEIYGRAYLHALVHGYRTAMHRFLVDRADIAAELQRRTASATPELKLSGAADTAPV